MQRNGPLFADVLAGGGADDDALFNPTRPRALSGQDAKRAQNGNSHQTQHTDAVRKMIALLGVESVALGDTDEQAMPVLAAALGEHVQEFERRGQLLEAALRGTSREEASRETRERQGGRLSKDAALAEARAATAERALVQAKEALEQARMAHLEETAALQRQLAAATRRQHNAARASPMASPLTLSPRSPRPALHDELPSDLTEERLRKFVVRVVRTVGAAPPGGPITPTHLQTTLDHVERLVAQSRTAERVANALGVDKGDDVERAVKALRQPPDEAVRLFCTLFGVEHAYDVVPAMNHVYAELSGWQSAARVMERRLGLGPNSTPQHMAQALIEKLS